MTVGVCGSVAGQAMFLPSDEDGSFAEARYVTNRYSNGYGMGLGMAPGGFALGVAYDFLMDGDVSSTAMGLFASLDARRLGWITSPASLQFTGGVVINESTLGFAFGPTVYVGLINPIGWMMYIHGGVTVLEGFDTGETGQYPANLGASLGYRSSGVIVAANLVAVFNKQVTTYSISLSLTFRKPQKPRFDDDF